VIRKVCRSASGRWGSFFWVWGIGRALFTENGCLIGIVSPNFNCFRQIPQVFISNK
jgi:hypothetical protein